MIEAYYRKYNDGPRWNLITPTGKYKLVTKTFSNGDRKIIMYVEVKTGFMGWSEEWVHEDDIKFIDCPDVKSETFICKN